MRDRREVQKASEQIECISDDEVVVKSQILAGGRGLGTFKSGFKERRTHREERRGERNGGEDARIFW